MTIIVCTDCRVSLLCTRQLLNDDLREHFRVPRNADQIGRILVNLLNTDFAFGLAAKDMDDLVGRKDAMLAEMAQTEVIMIPRRNGGT